MHEKCMVGAVPDTGSGINNQQWLVFSGVFFGGGVGAQILLLQQDSTNCKLMETLFLEEAS